MKRKKEFDAELIDKRSPFRTGSTELNDDTGSLSESSREYEPPKMQEKSQLRQIRDTLGLFLNSNPVQYFILSLIIINAIMMGIGTFDFVSKNDDLDNAFETVDEVFLIVFTIEAGLQVFYEGLNSFRNAWLMFDIIIVLFSWLLSGVQVIRALRIFRALRLVTRMKNMRLLVEALGKTLPRMAGISALLSLIIYIFSVMFTEFFRDLEPLSHPYFNRLDSSLLTSFQIMTFDNWAEIVREVMEQKSWAWMPFVAFVLITGFMVVHLVIAVICDAISDLNDEDKMKLEDDLDFKTFFDDDAVDGAKGSDMGDEKEQSPDAKPVIPELPEQVSTLEKQVQELVISNERTLHWLQQLTSKVNTVTVS